VIAVEDVYRDWDRQVMRSLRRRFIGTPEATLEDGAAFAWAQYVAKPPPDDYALAWLKLVARREVLRLIRAVREEPHETLPELGVSLDKQLEAREKLRQLERLRPHQRTALTCRLLGLSYQETERATGRTYTWVNRHTTEGRAALRELA
jgi:DNA-directed RNA polymerase specialized sigma24 family protein